MITSERDARGPKEHERHWSAAVPAMTFCARRPEAPRYFPGLSEFAGRGVVPAVMVFAGTAPLQWRSSQGPKEHERHWSAAVPAMTPRPLEWAAFALSRRFLEVLA